MSLIMGESKVFIQNSIFLQCSGKCHEIYIFFLEINGWQANHC